MTSQLAQTEISPEAPELICIAESGCGEGYYLGQLERCLEIHSPESPICYFGMDISKAAVKLAAKKYPGINFVVADVKDKIPLASGSARVLLNIFSPRNASEFGRILAREGLCLVVIPQREHLSDLRQDFGLLELEANKLERVKEQMGDVFDLARQHSLEYDLRLGGQALLDLIWMTPNYWHVSDQIRSRVMATAETQTKASFAILEFRRRAGH